MPNRYEREIEEILRNLDPIDPKVGKTQKFGAKFRRRPAPNLRPQPARSASWNLSLSERLLLGAVICAMLAGGYAFLAGPNIITLIVALIGFIGIVFVALSQFVSLPQRTQSVRYGNVTITPLRRSPWSTIKTQWNLFWLKLKYRRKNEP
ncbi:hypothetical protein [Dictyobacter arantiisoli]|uniref:DUF3040 domain-containing protein n=1 Tax=Dictyobacter arantiisoli TaxID=2014874 RepID=A0A5A5TAH9_9CHLR|nr:hypothetical protein [Dictyobacter arantiisoli]GCF07989.1 hypothetical protein KDI_15530 [Dictyobacter arantiisoli]